HIDSRRAEMSLGTLGGGNHFIEADRDDNGTIYLVVHSGSRHLGLEVAKYYQNEGYKVLNGSSQTDKNTKRTNIPKQLAYVSGDLFQQYIHDMKIVQRYAELNRQAMVDEIVKGMKLHVEEQFTTVHNYIDTDAMILRKGAVSARKNEKLLIPINMRDGSLICTGKGNDDWNQSAPHGAGRLMSRSEAKESFTVSEFKKQMSGIYTTSVNKDTLDECPMAYKELKDIVNNIGDTVEVDKIIKPIYNFKAGGE
ncbi:MAG: RtcB family protein, partial [Lachnospiraceae bacterium]|nr:RtcB family protein [Lachnospiraceae bacterium]